MLGKQLHKALWMGFTVTMMMGQIVFLGGPVEAGKVVMVLSHDKGPYQEVRAPIVKVLGEDLEEIILSKNHNIASSKVLGLIPEKTDLVIAMGKKAVGLAKNIHLDIPVYYSLVYDQVHFKKRGASGILVGIKIEQQIKLLRELFPERNRIGVIFNPGLTGSLVNHVRKIGGSHQFQLMAVPVGSRDEIQTACRRFTSNAVDLLLLVADPTVIHPASLKIIADYTRKNKIPLVGLSRFHVKSGAMLAFTVDFGDVGRQVIEIIQSGNVTASESRIIPPRKIDILVNEVLKKEMGIDDMREVLGVVYIQ
ncbi:hypothetical protein K8S19_11845 [bacterium]|nr:hypothetical protein [bacterium]